MRQTLIRKNIVEALTKADSPISALDVLSFVRKKNPKVNKTTIYRDLTLLVRENIVEEVNFGEGLKRYHIYKNLKHHHLICEHCGKVKNISCNDEKFIIGIQKRLKFKIKRHSAEFFGLCSSCQ